MLITSWKSESVTERYYSTVIISMNINVLQRCAENHHKQIFTKYSTSWQLAGADLGFPQKYSNFNFIYFIIFPRLWWAALAYHPQQWKTNVLDNWKRDSKISRACFWEKINIVIYVSWFTVGPSPWDVNKLVWCSTNR